MRQEGTIRSVRAKIHFVVAALGCIAVVECGRAIAGEAVPLPWWHCYPVYVGDIGGIGAEQVARLHARMVSGNYAADPVWGAYAQQVDAMDAARQFQEVKKTGAHWISWVETFGDCMAYAGAVRRNPDGSYQGYPNNPALPVLVRTAWSWEAGSVQPGHELCWIGPHNSFNDERFVPPMLRHERLGLPVPRYPDGREATGWIPGGQRPLNARLYDACCAKDVNGKLTRSPGMLPPAANTLDPATGKPKGPTEGLFRVVLDRDSLLAFPGHKVGDVVYAATISIPKDAAAPFWIDYIRVSVREILRHRVDGLWCDNYSPWDNFAQFDRAFGNWSEYRFRGFLADRLTADQRREMGIGDPASFQIRDYLKQQAAQLGASDPSNTRDPIWTDPRWGDDPVWNAYKVFKQHVGQEALQNFYGAVKDEARRAGRPDFLVAGNDIPLYGLGWVRDEYLDMVSSELMPSSYLSTGPRGIMVPPLGKSAVVYRAALEHQKGPYATAWYYLTGSYAKYQGRPELAKVLMAEAFANHTFLKYGRTPEYPGTPESVAWWNAFVTREEPRFGQRVVAADVGILFSPDNQLALLAPGGPPDASRQLHSFGHWGFATAMIDAHIPYRAVVDWKVNAKSLEGLRTFIIPEAQWLDDSVLPVLERWVRGGGRLVITGPSGTRNGTTGLFAKRKTSLLSSLVGIEFAETAGPAGVHRRSLNKGAVLWTPEPAGMDYYVHESQRHNRLPAFVELVGDSAVFDGRQLPSTVGAFCWKSADGAAVLVDLVNYDLDAEADRLTPARNLTFRVPLATKSGRAEATTLSPDGLTSATVEIKGGWAVVRVPQLLHFASVKLSPEPRAAERIVPPPLCSPNQFKGLTVALDGTLLRDGRPYRGVGANYFDLLLRVLSDPANTSSLDGLRRLGAAEIPFVRFAVAYDRRQWRTFFDDRAEFFRCFDLVVRTAERADVGLIPSFFWCFMDFPDLAGEPRDQWGNPGSRTCDLMRQVVGEIVERYKHSPAIWAWEFGNEPNLMADLPNAAQFRKPGGTEHDDLTARAMVVMLAEFAKEVRRHDPHRPIIAGHSHPRPAAWHNTTEKSWKSDRRQQTLEILHRDNPAPLDTIAIHLYGDPATVKELAAWATDHADYARAVHHLAQALKRPLFVGEFGLATKEYPAATRAGFEYLLAAMEAAEVDLAAFWVFDLKDQDKTWNVTFENDRAYMLKATAEANHRWNRAARRKGRN
jgi:hypothetical protein